MLPAIAKLLVIQDRDLKIRAIEKELDHLPVEEEDAREKLAGDRKRVDAAKLAMQENEVAMKNFELDIQTRRNSVGKLKIQQYETRKNEEFRAMGAEIERYGKEISDLEDRELILMEKGEEFRRLLAEAQLKLEATQRLVDEELADIEVRRSNLRDDKAELQANRELAEKDVEAASLDTYNRLFKSKGGLVVVPLVNGQCKGCHMKVVKSTAVAVKIEKEITHCESCGRILYSGDE
jgi:predicted  nucleic acid-binding Zn-ribbon protein